MAAATGLASSQGLPPGQHTPQPKYWSVLNRSVTNYTPLQFDYRIENLTPTSDGGLWFSLGSSIERIDPNGRMTNFAMPHALWRVSGITQVGEDTWFSAGQSGKVGKIDAHRRLSFVQVVPRRFFPDIGDLVVKRDGEMWFVDAGRRSIGYRAASGRLVEHQLPGGAFPGHMQHCMGRLWVTGGTTFGSRLAVIDDNLNARWFSSQIPQRGGIAGMSCDGRDNLWLTLNAWLTPPRAYAIRISQSGSVRVFSLPSSSVGNVASDASGAAIPSNAAPPGLLYVDKNGVTRSYPLPTETFTAGAIALGPDGTMWLSINQGNSPISVARVQKI